MGKISKFDKAIIAAIRLAGKSVELIKDKYKVSEKQIESYVKQYGDKEIVTVTNSSPIKVDWSEMIQRNNLTEEFIMENHEKLLSYSKDVYETDSDFILRQSRLPYIKIDKEDNESFKIRWKDKAKICWDTSEKISDD